MDSISIRPLEQDEWETLKSIRLLALSLHPEVYLGRYEEALDRSEAEWKDMLSGQEECIFGLFNDKHIIGITAVFTQRKDTTGQTGVLSMSFIQPDFRHKGLSDFLYKARIEWAINHLPWKTLAVSHREGNEPSRRSMLRHGFEYKSREKILWPDGQEDWEYNYELDLIKLREIKN